MKRAPLAALLTVSVCASLAVSAAGCAGSARPPTAGPTTALAPSPKPASGAAPAAAVPTANASATASASAASPATASAATPATASASAASSATANAASPATAAPSGSPAVAAATDSTAPPGSAATSAALAPLPVPVAPPPAPPPAPRVLLADELPYRPAHLRAHDSKAEPHVSREANRESGAGRESGRRPYHPAPGIVVDVVTGGGAGGAGDGAGAPAPDLQRAARNRGYWPFRQCYEEGLRRDPRVAGKVSLELAVGPNGAVDRSVVTVATVRDEIVAACVAREAQHLGLPASGSPTTAKVDVSLAVGDEPVPTGRPVANAEPIREALRASWDGVRRCYAGRLASHPGIGGRMELRFRLRHGEIVDVGEEAAGGDPGARFGDGDVTRCVLGVYRSARLPAKPHATRDRSFVYALELESAPVDAATP